MLLERVRYLVQESVTCCCGLVLQFASRASCDTENMRWKMIGDWGNLEGEIERVRYVVVASCTTATDGCDSVLQLKHMTPMYVSDICLRYMLSEQVVRQQLMVVTGSYNSNPPHWRLCHASGPFTPL